MSVFSLIRRGRAQAKEQKAKQAERQKEEVVKLPYRHVVTHAASDALSGAPSSWKHADRPRIMEQNKRRTAIMANESNGAGLPRVGSSLSYVSYASVYGTPVVPLPRNYSYNNVRTPWRDQLANFHEGPDYFAQSGSGKSAKGKEPERIRSPASMGPAPRRSHAEPGVSSNKDATHSGSTGNLSSSDDDLEMRTRVTINRRPQSLTYHSSVSQQSTSSSEKSYRTPLTSAGTGHEKSGKIDRYYPPRAQSTYFSAPRPLNRRTPVPEASKPPVSAVAERSNSTASSSSTLDFFSTTSNTPIGIAIAPPLSPSAVETPPTPTPGEVRVVIDRKRIGTASMEEPPIQSPRMSTAGQMKASTHTATTKPNGQAADPNAPPAQRRRRRLSKSRPLSSDGSRISTDTMRPPRLSLNAPRLSLNGITPTPSNYGQVDKTGEKVEVTTSVLRTSESLRKTQGKLSKSPETKQARKGWFTLRSSRTTTITAH